jgi:putative two-component system response regulator
MPGKRPQLKMKTTTTTDVTRPQMPAPAPSYDGFARFGKMKILVIDDEAANVALLEGILGDNGFTRVNSVTDSRLALDAWRTFQPDLILLDLMMPHLDGYAILEALRAESTETFLPVVILTADVNEKSKLRALRLGATDFLLKPFDQTEVLLRICNLLETRRLHLRLDNQRSAYEDAVRERESELRNAHSELEKANAKSSG